MLTSLLLDSLLSVSGAQKVLHGTFHTTSRIFAITTLLKAGRKYRGAGIKGKYPPIKMHSYSAYLILQKAKVKKAKYLCPPAQFSAAANSF